MSISVGHRRHQATLLLLALAFALPRLLLPPGYMPGTDHSDHFALVFCDPALRAAFSGHIHSHGSEHASGDTCPFAMSGGPALLSEASSAHHRAETRDLAPATVFTPALRTRSIAANGARAPPDA
jgi:hypothetical protein